VRYVSSKMNSWFVSLQNLSNLWAGVLATVGGGAAAAICWVYFNSADTTSNTAAASNISSSTLHSAAANTASAWVPVSQTGNVGHGSGQSHCDAPPAVPEANAGLVLLPLVGAVLVFSARRLWRTKRSLAAEDQRAR
jgi:hypothetical protein